MTKYLSERSSHSECVPSVPAPSEAHAGDGMELARELARRYLPDTVRLLAGIALAPDTEAGLHTRMMCARSLVEIAGVIPQATPEPPSQPLPLHERSGDDVETD
jgi:hypothetical protein